jgi:hypothetical protein
MIEAKTVFIYKVTSKNCGTQVYRTAYEALRFEAYGKIIDRELRRAGHTYSLDMHKVGEVINRYAERYEAELIMKALEGNAP